MSIRVEGLETSFPGFDFGPVEMEFCRGVTAVLGPSGSGKSTLLRLVAGLEEPDSGEVSLKGEEVTGLPPEERDVGMVFQGYALFPHLSVAGNVAYGASDPGVVEEVVEMLEIGDLMDRSPGELSGGERQRVALARTLAGEPEALLLDEPLSSLDAPIRRRLRRELRSLLSGLDIPVVYVTHDQEEATVVGDRLAVLGEGELHQVGGPREVRRKPVNRFVAEFVGAENVYEGEVVEREGDLVRVEWEGGRVEGFGEGLEAWQAVEFCVRPEDVMVIREGKPLRENIRENLYDGEVVDRVKGGTVHSVFVELEAGPQVKVEVPEHAYHRLEMDEREEVTLSFKRNRVHFMEGSG